MHIIIPTFPSYNRSDSHSNNQVSDHFYYYCVNQSDGFLIKINQLFSNFPGISVIINPCNQDFYHARMMLTGNVKPPLNPLVTLLGQGSALFLHNYLVSAFPVRRPSSSWKLILTFNKLESVFSFWSKHVFVLDLCYSSGDWDGWLAFVCFA